MSACLCLSVYVYISLSLSVYVFLSDCALSVSMSVYVSPRLHSAGTSVSSMSQHLPCPPLTLSTTNQPVCWLSVPRSVLTAFVPLLTSRPDSDLVRGHTILVKAAYVNRHVVAVHEIHAPLTIHGALAVCPMVAAQVFWRWHNGRSMYVRCSQRKSQVICRHFQGASRSYPPLVQETLHYLPLPLSQAELDY